MSIIDDFSRKVWVYILKEKSEAYNNFKNWCKEMENVKGRCPKVLRTDNGLKYLSKVFDGFCQEKDIRRHKIVSANPQQNGVAERMNRTLLERVRCLLSSSGAGKQFWAEAVSTAAFLINKCPSSSIGGSIPDEMWYGSSPDYSRLRPFGCKAFAHQKQGKLSARVVQCIMLGYQRGVKGYRLWCVEPGNQKVVVSRDVVFIEDQMPFLIKNPAESSGAEPQAEAGFEVESGSSSDQQHIQTDVTDGVLEDYEEALVPPQDQQPSSQEYQIGRDRPRRTNLRPLARFSDYEMMFYALHIAKQIELSELGSYTEAINGSEKLEWLQAMKEEIQSLLNNKTWILVDKAEFRKIIGCKWVFKKKIETTESQNGRFKARLVAKGFNQEERVDFNEVYSPVVKHNSIRVLLAIAAKKNWELK